MSLGRQTMGVFGQVLPYIPVRLSFATMNNTRRNAVLAGLAMLATSLGTPAQEPTGRVLVAVGICTRSAAEYPVLSFRKVDGSAHFNPSGAAFGQWDYTDQTGRFVVRSAMLAAGEWEMYRFEMQSTEPLGKRIKYRPRKDYSHRFTIATGKVVDLGRYCAATQTMGEKYPDSEKVWNQVVRLAYMHVSPNRADDVEKARKTEGGAPLELVGARPDPPELVSPALKSRFIEPRVLAKPMPHNPMAPPTSPVN